MRPHKLLRAALVENDLTAAELAGRIGIHETTMCRRMTGAEPWRLDEMYAAMDTLHLPYSRLHEYFPKGGKS